MAGAAAAALASCALSNTTVRLWLSLWPCPVSVLVPPLMKHASIRVPLVPSDPIGKRSIDQSASPGFLEPCFSAIFFACAMRSAPGGRSMRHHTFLRLLIPAYGFIRSSPCVSDHSTTRHARARAHALIAPRQFATTHAHSRHPPILPRPHTLRMFADATI